ncbi:hypothetical protein [Nostoc sp.]|uniref:hypothetical protein n=1 Tax=Nostoc sp. TaxID=1180 RepID=UPI002FFC151D
MVASHRASAAREQGSQCVGEVVRRSPYSPSLGDAPRTGTLRQALASAVSRLVPCVSSLGEATAVGKADLYPY